ncbi:MAG: hypothetical protein JO101_02155, partial [Candidatus Eremiobacteraeota bacterium]|nr:hypothetical protein [Candidatus Eremiobacteraeota bacterium]MBV8354096.1 hypothetical protein [Candidatus Eremiobacteraeota bacterium]
MTCKAVSGAPDLELAAGFARRLAGERIADHVEGVRGDASLFDDLDTFCAQGLDVVVDFTVYPVSLDVARCALGAGAAPVVGATGWTEEDVISFQDA